MNINNGFSKPMKSLHAHEALVLANRWAKLQDAHPTDIKKFYTLRDEKIASWIAEESVVMTRILCRQSKPLKSMKAAINSEYILIEHLNYNRWQQDKKSERVKYWKMMESIAYEEGGGVLVPLPETERKQLNEIYNKKLQLHKQSKKKVTAKNKQGSKTKNSELSDRSSPTTIPRKPSLPELFTLISFEECLELKIPEVVKALKWARSLLNQPELSISDIDIDLVSEIEQAIIKEDLESLNNQAYIIFQQTINGHLAPIEVYERLTALNLDYSETLGLKCRQDRFGNNHVLDFGSKHELNLSLTGLWLVEYQSVLFPEIFWYSRYDCVPKPQIAHLAQIEIDQDELIQELSIQEQQTYPIANLMQILHISIDDFPRKLKKYLPKFNLEYRRGEDDIATWELAGY